MRCWNGVNGSFSRITNGLASCDLVLLVDAKVGICDRKVGIFDLEVDDDVELEELEVGNGPIVLVTHCYR